ncbi:hypothetical protein Dimus_037096, partial [Dionaea muscipula]
PLACFPLHSPLFNPSASMAASGDRTDGGRRLPLAVAGPWRWSSLSPSLLGGEVLGFFSGAPGDLQPVSRPGACCLTCGGGSAVVVLFYGLCLGWVGVSVVWCLRVRWLRGSRGCGFSGSVVFVVVGWGSRCGLCFFSAAVSFTVGLVVGLSCFSSVGFGAGWLVFVVGWWVCFESVGLCFGLSVVRVAVVSVLVWVVLCVEGGYVTWLHGEEEEEDLRVFMVVLVAVMDVVVMVL